MRRGTGLRSKIASAATASGGETIAPSVNASGHRNAEITACTDHDDHDGRKDDQAEASNEIGRQLRLSSIQSVAHAAL